MLSFGSWNDSQGPPCPANPSMMIQTRGCTVVCRLAVGVTANMMTGVVGVRFALAQREVIRRDRPSYMPSLKHGAAVV